MRYAIYGGSSHLNRSVSSSLNRTQRCTSRIFFDIDELQLAIESGPVIDILMLTDPASDPDLPVLLEWLERQPCKRRPRPVTLRHEGIPSTDMDLVQIDNVTQATIVQQRTSFLAMQLHDERLIKNTRREVREFDANNKLLLKVFGRYVFERGNTVVVDHVPVHLTNKLFQLAWYLFGQVDDQVSRAALYRGVWGNFGDPSSRSLDTHVSILRSRLHLVPGNGYVLRAIYGRGYTLQKEYSEA